MGWAAGGGPRTFRAVRGERRGDLLGAQPGPRPRPTAAASRPARASSYWFGLANHAAPEGGLHRNHARSGREQ